MRHLQIYLFFLICLAALSCNSKKSVDISNIKLNIPIERFDQELSGLNSDSISEIAPDLRKKYTWFYDDYMEMMVGAGPTRDTGYYTNLRSILRNKDYLELSSTVAQTFPSLEKQQLELNQAFR